MNRIPPSTWSFALILLVLASVLQARSETVVLTPSADTTLHEKFPGNNLGANADLSAGTVSTGEKTRALLKFDLAGKIPTNATIVSAQLKLQIIRQPSSGGASGVLQLNRVRRMWVEGVGKSLIGEPANTGETTWALTMSPGMPWSEGGGSFGSDFASTPSASASFGGLGSVTIPSSRELAADVQSWLADPGGNLGWVLAVNDENVRESARRIASREDPTRAPQLVVEYILGSNELRLDSISLTATHALLSWSGGTAPFQVQRKSRLGDDSWVNVGEATSNRVFQSALIDSTGFYRVRLADSAAPTNSNPSTPGGSSTNTPPGTATNSLDTAEYEVAFKSEWTSATHPQEYPIGAHWSPLVGGTHRASAVFWEGGGLASRGIEDMAEVGSIVNLRNEINAAIGLGTAFNVFTRPGSIPGNGTVFTSFTMHRDFPLVTLVTMIAPSPDWFTGVHGISLRENGAWVETKTVVLNLYDAGTDSGRSYASLDSDTQPRERIRQITGFPASVNGQLVPFGTFTFKRKK